MKSNKKILEFLKLFPDAYFALIHDKSKDMIEFGNTLDIDRAYNYQRFGYALFFTPNGFKGRRTQGNLSRINAWTAEIDGIRKKEQMRRLQQSPLSPNLIIESRNSFHCYWMAKDGAAENYKEIVANRLIPFFGADTGTGAVNHFLRVPFFMHQKKRPFLVTIYKPYDGGSYSEAEMISAFAPIKPSPLERIPQTKTAQPIRSSKLSNIEMLNRLSGTHWVMGENYSFKENRDGTQQISVNGKLTGCWIRKDGSIGSHSAGMAGVYQWLEWYGIYSPSNIKKIIRSL